MAQSNVIQFEAAKLKKSNPTDEIDDDYIEDDHPFLDSAFLKNSSSVCHSEGDEGCINGGFSEYADQHITVNITTGKENNQVVVQGKEYGSVHDAGFIAIIMEESSSTTFYIDNLLIPLVEMTVYSHDRIGLYEPLELFSAALFKCEPGYIYSVLDQCDDGEEMADMLGFCIDYLSASDESSKSDSDNASTKEENIYNIRKIDKDLAEFLDSIF